MSIIGGVLERRWEPGSKSIEDKSVALSAANILDWVNSGKTTSGVQVTEATALGISTVYACVRVLTESVSALPLKLFERLEPRGKRAATDHPLYPILHDNANPWMSAMTLIETLTGHVLLWGNAYAEVMRNGAGRVVGIFPLRPDRMGRPVVSQAQTLIYPYQLPHGQTVELPQVNVLHIRGLSSDGLQGYSPVAVQRDALGLAKAAERFQGHFIANNARPSGVLSVKGQLDNEGAQRLRASWQLAHGGLENTQRVAVLEEGVTWQQIGMPLQDAQFMELRRYQRSEIAGWFRVPAHLINDLEHATFSNVEHLSLDFVVHCLRPWLVRWEKEIGRTLLTELDRQRYFAEFLVDGLLRGDSESRSNYYVKMRDAGALSPNDIRELENQNPIDGGDEYFVPLNMIPLRLSGAAAQAQIDGKQQPAVAKNALPEAGEQRAEPARLELREVFHPRFVTFAEAIVAAEVDAIVEHGLDRLGQRTVDGFVTWLEQYHAGTLVPLIEKLGRPLFNDLAEAIDRQVARELNLDTLTPDPDYAETMAHGMAETYAGKSLRLLRKTARQAEQGFADPVDAVKAELASWGGERPIVIADAEVVRAGEGLSVSAYRRAGVQQLVWRTRGKSCPYCEHMNGKRVRTGEHFLQPGGSFSVPGQKFTFTKKRGAKSPPLHRGCDCVVVPA